MAITTRDGLIAAQAGAQRLRILKTATRTSVATIPFSVFDLAGDPGAGTLAGSSTTAGVVPTDATTGVPIINAFGGGAIGHVTRAEFSSSVACRIALYDLLWKGGAYAFNADVTLASQPSFASRVTFYPGSVVDYKGTELWLEAVTPFTGNQSVQVNYLDQDGIAGDTGVIATAVAPIAGRMLRLPLASGDTGVQRIDRVRSTVSTVGTFNVLVMRKLAESRIRVANDQVVQGVDLVGLTQVFADSALVAVVYADGTSTGLPEVVVDIGNG